MDSFTVSALANVNEPPANCRSATSEVDLSRPIDVRPWVQENLR